MKMLIRESFKSACSLFGMMMRVGERLAGRSHFGGGCVTPLILHHTPLSSANDLRQLLVRLQAHYDFIDPKLFGSMISKEGRENRRKHLLLTFDDGFHSNRVIAEEVLEPLGIHAIFFLPSDFIDCTEEVQWRHFVNDHIYPNLEMVPDLDELAPMSWEDVRWLVEQGHVIGSHTCSHARLSEVKDTDMLDDELRRSGERISECIGQVVEHFAFPFGDIGSVSEEAISVASRYYRFLHSGVRGTNFQSTSPLALRRESLALSDTLSFNLFVADGRLAFRYAKQRHQLDEMVRGVIPNSLHARHL